ncbi:MAG TPA: DUF3592 domain-containing protein [Chloroflexia bacterium]|nr:DUF3592 domain-containing protein [Chloroflexia bacterium]
MDIELQMVSLGTAWGLVLAFLYFFFSGIAFYLAIYTSRKIRNERDWPTVPGEVLERGVGAPMHGPGRYFLPHAKYTYSIGGRVYANDQVYLIRGTGFLRDTVQRLVDRLPNPVPVHYDPADPRRSYLLANGMGISWICLGFGVFALLLGLMQLVVEVNR